MHYQLYIHQVFSCPLSNNLQVAPLFPDYQILEQYHHNLITLVNNHFH